MKKDIAIIGADSFIGKYLYEYFKKQVGFYTYYHNDIDKNGVYLNLLKLHDLKFDKDIKYCFILSSISNPDNCYCNKKHCYKINVKKTKTLLLMLKKRGIVPIFFSSEAVYDGIDGNFIEEDADPILLYGKYKLIIEKFIEKNFKKYIILRLGRVVGDRLFDGTIFSNWFLDIINNRNISCAYDQNFSFLYVIDLNKILKKLINKNIFGVFNIANNSGESRCKYLEDEITFLKKNGITYNKEIKKISINDFNTLEKRPKNLSLNCKRLHKKLKFRFSMKKHLYKKLYDNYIYILKIFKRDRVDFSGKSLAIFINNYANIDKYIKKLKKVYLKCGLTSLRLCLHHNKSEYLHSMIILIDKKNKNNIHKHDYDEFYVLIEGEILIIIYDDKRNAISKVVLNKYNRVLKIDKDIFHKTVILSDFALFNEYKAIRG